MMILNQNKVKLANEDTPTRRNLDLTSGIYIIAGKVAQYRQLAENRRKKEEAKNVTEKKIATRKVHLQLTISEAFDTCINSTNSLSSSTIDEERLIQLTKQSSNTIKDNFVHIGGKLDELPNQRRDTVAREMNQIMKRQDTIIMSPCHPYPSPPFSSYHPSPSSTSSSCQPPPPWVVPSPNEKHYLVDITITC